MRCELEQALAAMREALDDLESPYVSESDTERALHTAIAAAEAALAAPAEEPVAWQSMHAGIPVSETHDPAEAQRWRDEGTPVRALYAEPVARKLTDEQIIDLWSPPIGGDVRRPVLGKNKIIAFARSVIATSQAEPVARKPLTDEEIDALWADAKPIPKLHPGQAVQDAIAHNFARAVERAHGIE